MTYAEWLSAHMQTWGSLPSPGEAWAFAERQALERAAEICDEVSVDRWNLYKGRAPYSGSEDGRASEQVQGESDGAEACAAAIRALMQDGSSVVSKEEPK